MTVRCRSKGDAGRSKREENINQKTNGIGRKVRDRKKRQKEEKQHEKIKRME
jgi:hypothetical protein